MAGKFAHPTHTLMSKKGSYKEIDGTILNPHRVHLAIIFVPCSVSGEYSEPIYDKITKTWKGIQNDYRSRFVNRESFKLGENILSLASPEIWICQALCLNEKNEFDKKALDSCLEKLVETAKYDKGYIHLSNDALVQYPEIKKITVEFICNAGINLFAYNEPEQLVRR